jgi:hypothetical protein
MADRGRIVVVSAGFALWVAGRCVAAARFSDIRRLRAVAAGDGKPDALALRVELTDGSLMELHEESPGFALFVERAGTSLKGLTPAAEWSAALEAATDPDRSAGVLLFQKPKGW